MVTKDSKIAIKCQKTVANLTINKNSQKVSVNVMVK